MKIRGLATLGAIVFAGSMSGQTLTDVINEFNTGVEKLNNQEYEISVEHFNQVLAMAETVGDEANDMRSQAEKQIPSAYYRQATVFMKRKQYDNAIPYLEKTVESSTMYSNNDEIKGKSLKYLPQLHTMEGNRQWKNKQYEESLAHFDKALELDESLYKAHLGKGLVFLDQDETDMMLEEFKLAKEGANSANDTKTLDQINGKIDSYYNKFITEELEMVDPEENDFTYVVEACENALKANPENPRALYHLALVSNKKVEYDAAVDYALQALKFETEAIWLSAINFELGSAYQNSVEYDKACETFKQVLEEPFLSRAEKKMASLSGCN